MREGSPKSFDKLADFLLKSYAEKGYSVRDLVRTEMRKHTSLNPNEAYEEVIARLCESFLRDAHLNDRAAELYQTDMKTANKVLAFLKGIKEKIKSWFTGKVESEIGKIGEKLVKKYDHALDLFVEGIRNASENLAYAKNTTGEAKPKLMARESEDNQKKITLGMSDSERYEVLKNRTLNNIPAVTEEIIKKASINSWDDINSVLGDQKRQLIHKLASEFGVFKGYENSDIDLEFEFSNNNFRESYHYQKKNYVDFTKMFSVFDDVVSNAVGIEVHNRNKEGYKPDPTLKAVYVLVSAYRDGENIVPVKLEIKEFKDKANGLYVAIALEKIKATEVSKQGDTENGVTQNSRSIANISIAQLFRKNNPNDEQFIKYIPQQFINNDTEKSSRDSDYLSAVNRGDMQTAQKMVDEAAKDAGYTIKAYHGIRFILKKTRADRADRPARGRSAARS